jgi:hypothetical protein
MRAGPGGRSRPAGRRPARRPRPRCGPIQTLIDEITDRQLAQAESHTSSGLRSAEGEAMDRLPDNDVTQALQRPPEQFRIPVSRTSRASRTRRSQRSWARPSVRSCRGCTAVADSCGTSSPTSQVGVQDVRDQAGGVGVPRQDEHHEGRRHLTFHRAAGGRCRYRGGWSCCSGSTSRTTRAGGGPDLRQPGRRGVPADAVPYAGVAAGARAGGAARARRAGRGEAPCRVDRR